MIRDDSVFWLGDRKLVCAEGVHVGSVRQVSLDHMQAEFVVTVHDYEEAVKRGLLVEVKPDELDLMKIRHRKEEIEVRARMANSRKDQMKRRKR